MANIDRRDFIKLMGAGAVAGAGLFGSRSAFSAAQPHVVVLGGGTGGATAAKYLKLADENIRVTIVERNKEYVRCYGSNEVLTDHCTMDDLTIGYETLQSKYGIEFIFDTVVGVDPHQQKVSLQDGSSVNYDRLIVSPGIDYRWEAIDGFTPEVAETSMPHAWKAGPQTELLRRQIHGMPEDGTVLIAAPPNPYRCPPAPYERASLLAEWFKTHKPRAKILLMDPKEGFTKDQPFMLAWNRLYGFNIPNSHMEGMPDDVKTHDSGQIEWVPGSEGGKITSVEPKTNTVHTANLDTIQADVVNIIPPQKAGKLAFTMGLTNEQGWCDVNRKTFESRVHDKIHVIGDSCIADDMPKSGYAANTQAKVCAVQVAHLLRDEPLEEPLWENTCFSRANSEYGVSIADVYKLKDGKIKKVTGAGGVSPLDAPRMANRLEALYQESWMRAFVKDCFA